MNKLKVSITTYPRRFNMLKRVLESLELQTYTDFDVVITLYKQECENDLDKLNKIISNSKLKIELNFVDTNTYCHKNTFEVMKLYPDNPILVIDDDILRLPDCIKNFVQDYLDYNCIIARNYDYFLKNEELIKTMGGLRRNRISNMEMYFTGKEMPNTGGNGILYPPNCFKDPRYYDKDLILQCSPTSTEVWLYYWLCKEQKLLYFKYEQTWKYRLDLCQKEGCLYMTNTLDKRKEFLKNCEKMLGEIS